MRYPEVTPSIPTTSLTAKWAQPCRAPRCGRNAHAWLCVICGGMSARIASGYAALTGCVSYPDARWRPFTKWTHDGSGRARPGLTRATTPTARPRCDLMTALLALRMPCSCPYSRRFPSQPRNTKRITKEQHAMWGAVGPGRASHTLRSLG
jgi:hypothetical protein